MEHPCLIVALLLKVRTVEVKLIPLLNNDHDEDDGAMSSYLLHLVIGHGL